MIAAFDVQYSEDAVASLAAVLFESYGAAEPSATYTHQRPYVSDYIPGQFYKRELPCLLDIIDRLRHPPDEMIIDGYVMHSDGPGLGMHLYLAMNSRIPVIGVAKSRYADSPGIEILRGRSRKPLIITSAGIEGTKAADRIKRMHGRHRIPTLLKLVDRLARESKP